MQGLCAISGGIFMKEYRSILNPVICAIYCTVWAKIRLTILSVYIIID